MHMNCTCMYSVHMYVRVYMCCGAELGLMLMLNMLILHFPRVCVCVCVLNVILCN